MPAAVTIAVVGIVLPGVAGVMAPLEVRTISVLMACGKMRCPSGSARNGKPLPRNSSGQALVRNASMMTSDAEGVEIIQQSPRAMHSRLRA
jgi:hypothetical protein